MAGVNRLRFFFQISRFEVSPQPQWNTQESWKMLSARVCDTCFSLPFCSLNNLHTLLPLPSSPQLQGGNPNPRPVTVSSSVFWVIHNICTKFRCNISCSLICELKSQVSCHSPTCTPYVMMAQWGDKAIASLFKKGRRGVPRQSWSIAIAWSCQIGKVGPLLICTGTFLLRLKFG